MKKFKITKLELKILQLIATTEQGKKIVELLNKELYCYDNKAMLNNKKDGRNVVTK